ncbi:MAG: zinc dependent phospholipase C family protein [Acidobacteriota bacterium]|nr:zinc dependent phospholipase C family protein [Acidobacteriota bacterium]
MRKVSLVVLTLVILAGLPLPASAWGFEAHKFVMGRVISLLPPEIRPFFERYQASIVEHSIDPDLWRTAGWLEEPPRHFLDMDAYGPYPFAQMPRVYEDAVKRYGSDFVRKNGTLPWRAEEFYGKLVEAFTQKASYSRENIRFFSSVLAHYVADAHVPFHAALNYDGQLTGQWGIHARFESELFERYRSRLRIAPRPVAPVPEAREFMFQTLLTSFPLVQRVLDADKAAIAGRDTYDDSYFNAFFLKAGPILEERLSDSIAGTASIITAAWVGAGRPALPVNPPRTPRKVRQR